MREGRGDHGRESLAELMAVCDWCSSPPHEPENREKRSQPLAGFLFSSYSVQAPGPQEGAANVQGGSFSSIRTNFSGNVCITGPEVHLPGDSESRQTDNKDEPAPDVKPKQRVSTPDQGQTAGDGNRQKTQALASGSETLRSRQWKSSLRTL